MKKTILGLTLIATLVLALGISSVVSADSGDPTPQPARCSFVDRIFNSDECGIGRPDGTRINDGILHDYMVKALSDKLGISVADLETRIADGETMAEIALDKGLTIEEFQTWMLDTRIQVIDQAVKDGKLTTEQAEWMKSHRGAMMFGGAGRSQGFGMMGRTGRMGGFGGFQNCPNLP